MISYRTLMTPETLLENIGRPNWLVFDCRFDLTNPNWGMRAYLDSHIPGAQYVDLERDLSAPRGEKTGRHPLPSPQHHIALFSRLGIERSSQVVVYDNRGGGLAARMWWALHYLGHEAVAVLDGGFPAWVDLGFPLEMGEITREAKMFQAHPREDMVMEAEEIEKRLERSAIHLIDSRTPARHRGEEEPYDPVAGRIPGSSNRYWEDNLDDAGRFRPAQELQDKFVELLKGATGEETVVYCGSGVTACHNLLALEIAGIGGARLYPGSWSEWCSDPTRPIEP